MEEKIKHQFSHVFLSIQAVQNLNRSATMTPEQTTPYAEMQGGLSEMEAMKRALQESELDTFLERAKLLSYKEVFIANGAEDLDDLLKADKEELEEIMSLVGMGSKPVHKMRLKRALKGEEMINNYHILMWEFLMSTISYEIAW